jgi:predicted N-acetyltransferase YhbS
MERVLAALRKLGATGCVVLGDPKYTAALALKQSWQLRCPMFRRSISKSFISGGRSPPRALYHSHEAFSVRG